MSQILETDEWSKFFQVVKEMGKHNFGEPEKPFPRFVSFQNTDRHFPTDKTLERGPDAIRKYWNDKNLRKRKMNMESMKSKKSFINNPKWKVEITETKYS